MVILKKDNVAQGLTFDLSVNEFQTSLVIYCPCLPSFPGLASGSPRKWKSCRDNIYPESLEFISRQVSSPIPAQQSTIFKIQSINLGAPPFVKQYGSWFSYNETARSLIIDREQSKIKDLDSFMSVMRYNDFENDPLASIQGCGPVPNPAGSLASRLDLSDPNVKCSFSKYDYMIGFLG